MDKNDVLNYLDWVWNNYKQLAWGKYTYNAVTGEAITDLPLPHMMFYAVNYLYYYKPDELKTVIDYIRDLDLYVNFDYDLEPLAEVLSGAALMSKADGSLAEKFYSFAKDVITNAFTHYKNLPYRLYNPSTKASTDNNVDPNRPSIFLANAMLYIKENSELMKKAIEVIKFLADGAGHTFVPLTINADDGSAIATNINDGSVSAQLESLLIAYATSKRTLFLELAKILARKMVRYMWDDDINMFVACDSDGNKYSQSDMKIAFEGTLISKDFALLHHFTGKRKYLEYAETNVENRFYRQLEKGLVQDFIDPYYEYRYSNPNYVDSDFYSYTRPEFVSACMHLYAVTGNDKFVDMALKNFEAVVTYQKSNYGFVAAVDVRDMSIVDQKQADWFYEFTLIPFFIDYDIDDITITTHFETPI